MLNRAGGVEPPGYDVPPAPGLVLDVANYRMPAPADVGAPGEPTSVQLVGKSGVFAARWDASRALQTISGPEVEVLRGQQEFPGMIAGETWMIAFGHERRAEGAEGEVTFFPFWAATVRVTGAKPSGT